MNISSFGEILAKNCVKNLERKMENCASVNEVIFTFDGVEVGDNNGVLGDVNDAVLGGNENDGDGDFKGDNIGEDFLIGDDLVGGGT
jgi:hypothetical protein